jgi:hypothetical protein
LSAVISLSVAVDVTMSSAIAAPLRVEELEEGDDEEEDEDDSEDEEDDDWTEQRFAAKLSRCFYYFLHKADARAARRAHAHVHTRTPLHPVAISTLPLRCEGRAARAALPSGASRCEPAFNKPAMYCVGRRPKRRLWARSHPDAPPPSRSATTRARAGLSWRR